MRPNSLKQKLINQEQTYGSWITMAHPLIPDILAPAGFDWLAVDMEHSSIDLADLLPLLISIEANGIVPLVRVGEVNPNLIKRVMDAGTYGVIAANICSAEDVKKVVSAVKYSPEGSRGVGFYRAQAFGNKIESYFKWVKEQSVVIVQIEHIAAVNEIEEIFAVPGIDAFMIGPNDLSGSMNKPCQFDDPEVIASIEKVLEAGKKYNLPAGYHVMSSDPVEAAKWRERGFKFLGLSLDSIFLGDSVKKALQSLKNEC